MISTLLLLSIKADSVGFDRARLAQVSARMAQFVRENELAGVVTLVRRKGKDVLFEAQGNATMDPLRKMEKDTVFQVMSMTKPITATAVMICAERGLLNLDDRVEQYIPALANLQLRQPDGGMKRPASGITIRNLLTHTSGLSSSDPGGLDDDSKRKLDLAEYVSRFGSDPLGFEPGSQISYSGPGITIAGRIVEIVTKRRFEEFLQQEVFDKLSMRDTTFFAPNSFVKRLARMYWFEDGRWKTSSEDPMRPGARFANPAGGLYSTASDMATFIQSFVDGKGRLLSPRSIHAMTTLQTGNLLSDGADLQGSGLGFSVIRHPAGSPTLRPAGSFGHTGAFGTEYWADPATKCVVVYMSQSFNSRPRKTFNTMVNAAFVGP